MHTTDLAALAARSREQRVRIRVGRVIDGVSDHALRDVDVVFDAKQIHSVSKSQGTADAVLPDHTLLPCLIEAHAHMFLDGAPIGFQQREQYLKESPNWMLERAKKRWPKILQCGVGTIRDAGDKHGVGLALAAEARDGKRKMENGKRELAGWIDSPGAAIHHRGRYGSFMGEPIEDHSSPAACVAARVARGADRIKLLVSGIINFKAGQVTTPPQMSIAKVKALVEAARHHGKQTFAHASGADGVEHSIEGGVTTVEHGFFITEEQLGKMRDRRIAWVPTFAPVQVQIDRAPELNWDEQVVLNLKHIIDSHQQMLRKAHELGVIVLAGSDAGSCGVPHGLGLLEEMEQMERAGMPPMAVLRSATGVSAATLDFAEPVGRIAPGCRSRMILTRHDPLQTVVNLQKQKTVIFDGHAIASPAHFDTSGL